MLKIDWNKLDWNKSDTQLAAELGCCAPTVGAHRRGLDKRKHMRTSHRIEWSALGPLWALPNYVLAERLSCSPSAVGYAREQFAPDSLKDTKQLNNRYRLSEGLKRKSPVLAADPTAQQLRDELAKHITPIDLTKTYRPAGWWATSQQPMHAQYNPFDQKPTVGYKARRASRPAGLGFFQSIWRWTKSVFSGEEEVIPKGGGK